MKKIVSMGLACLAAITLSACETTSSSPQTQTSKEVQDQIDQLIRLGKKTQQSGDHRNALTFYQRAYSLDARDKTTLFLLAETSRTLGDIRAVESLYANALAKTPDDVDILTRYGNVLVELDKLPQAIIQYEKALILDPHAQTALSGLGVAYDMQGRQVEAQQQYEKALMLAPNDQKLLNNYALSLALSGDYDQAISKLAPFANDPQASKRLRLNLALIYGLKGEMDKASEVAAQVLDKESVENNLKAYEQLRQLSKEAQNKAIMGQ